MTDYGIRLEPQHQRLLRESAIPVEHARARDYMTADTKKRLDQIGIAKKGQNIPGLLIPLRDKQGSAWGWQYRPDSPRAMANGKPQKYETPVGQRNGIDVPPGVGPALDDPSVELWITEGSRKADSAWCLGIPCISLSGVWNWRGTNQHGGKLVIPDWHEVALNGRRIVAAFDSDATVKPEVRYALEQFTGWLATKGASIRFCHLPHSDDGKTGLDDYIGQGHTKEDLYALVRPDMPELPEPELPEDDEEVAEEEKPRPPLPDPITLEQCHATFKKWLGSGYDGDALNAVLAAAAVERMTGDPLWLLVVSGSGNAKTELVQACRGAGALITSTIASEGALLSATPQKDKAKDATGGLLRSIGKQGILVVKDFTSIISANARLRGEVLAAFREIYDGYWVREVGSDGGRRIPWSGRIAVIGAVTTKWDQAHDVVAAMGDRFVLIRTDSATMNLRLLAGTKAIRNTGSEEVMRKELTDAIGGVIAGMRIDVEPVSDAELNALLISSNLVTLARTGVEYDYQGNVIDSHAPEMPTRFAKQLTQVMLGANAVGVSREDALKLALRCARDSMPPIRLAIIKYVAAHPSSTPGDVRAAINKPWTTVKRQLEALYQLSVLDMDEVEEANRKGEKIARPYYSLASDIDASVATSPEKLLLKDTEDIEEEDLDEPPLETPSNFSGDPDEEPTCWQCGKGLWPDGSCSRCRPAANLFGEETTA
jgi:hypothetical protein